MTEPHQTRTTITIDIEWTNPAAGTYYPAVSVAGDIPDGLNPFHAARHYIKATHILLRNTPDQIDRAFSQLHT